MQTMQDVQGYSVRFAAHDQDLLACQRLRHRCFFGAEGVDADAFDADCDHLMVCDSAERLVSTVRLRLSQASHVGCGYTGQFYDLTALTAFPAPVLEIGRMCTAPDAPDPHILRVVWGALTILTEAHQVGLIFGCSSFEGTSATPHVASFQRLHARYLAPSRYGSFRGAAEHVGFADLPAQTGPQAVMPPLMRTYLAMGGWVSDHAVIDGHMGTLHVLTGIEIANIPAGRAKVLRGLGTSGDVSLDLGAMGRLVL